jgi:beta-galactosidase/beta-glucuronidase
MTTIPRPEYPRPQFVRADWMNLNGTWQFEIDSGDSGLDRGLMGRQLAGEITVPFCPESVLSGVGNTDFLNAVWYRREVAVPPDWKGRRVLLHFGAVDYDATVWVNGIELVRHRGGSTPFTADTGDTGGTTVTVVLRARDYTREPGPRGKQSQQYGRHTCLYTRTTGIWQTVWMEPVGTTHLKRPRITPNLAAGEFRIQFPIGGNPKGHQIAVTVSDDHGTVGTATVAADLDFAPAATAVIPPDRRRAWSIDDPHLYKLKFVLTDATGVAVDSVDSYSGLRSVTIDGLAVKINGHTVFQRLVLDQGYYPDGLLTAPTDQALIGDIELSIAAGFNGARLHQKVFEERFLYHADRLGYIVWGEFPDWGCNSGPAGDNQQPTASFITEWLEAVERDYSHPSIVGWCPMNETAQRMTDKITQLDAVNRGMFLAAKAMDLTRPVLDSSGYSHRVTESDIWDSHDYEQNVETFRAKHAGTVAGEPFFNPDPNAQGKRSELWSLPYKGQPYFCSEFGGIWWNPDAKPGQDSWGYGERCKTLEEFFTRFEGLCAVLLDDASMFGYCYTQLTDVFQEQNGVYGFDRRAKFDLTRVRAAQVRRAAIEIAADA